jgi:BirA family biotin operon repressor/biotin-[acetyl-CoA-carboxylase] ligase
MDGPVAAALKPEELLPLIEQLADGDWHSGEILAAQAQVTRAALAKRMDRLKAWGLAVEARTGLGYRFERPLERLDASAILRASSELVRTRLRKLEVVAIADSTNLRLLETDGSADPRALLAEHQSAGRGRRGREWISPFGANLYLSLAWSFPHWPPQLTALPLAVGVACARALALGGLGLKWPNDLSVNGRKLGGILIEQRGEAGGACRTVVGVGLNVTMQGQQGAQIAQPWISLAEATSGSPSRNALAAQLITQLVLALEQFSTSGFAGFRSEWSRLDLTRDRQVRVEQGHDSFEGTARGVDESGALLVETASGLQRVLAGDVSLRLQ